jgi:hypothetical protein
MVSADIRDFFGDFETKIATLSAPSNAKSRISAVEQAA